MLKPKTQLCCGDSRSAAVCQKLRPAVARLAATTRSKSLQFSFFSIPMLALNFGKSSSTCLTRLNMSTIRFLPCSSQKQDICFCKPVKLTHLKKLSVWILCNQRGTRASVLKFALQSFILGLCQPRLCLDAPGDASLNHAAVWEWFLALFLKPFVQTIVFGWQREAKQMQISPSRI